LSGESDGAGSESEDGDKFHNDVLLTTIGCADCR